VALPPRPPEFLPVGDLKPVLFRHKGLQVRLAPPFVLGSLSAVGDHSPFGMRLTPFPEVVAEVLININFFWSLKHGPLKFLEIDVIYQMPPHLRKRIHRNPSLLRVRVEVLRCFRELLWPGLEGRMEYSSSSLRTLYGCLF
jgi:hypothetical protein